MTNRFALIFGALLIGVILADLLVFGWDLHVFFGKKLGELTEWMAFWR